MTYLFAFDAFCFPYYLEYQIGDVTTIGLASIQDKALVFHRNWENGYSKADFERKKNERVYGTLYQLTDDQMAMVAEKVLTGFRLRLEEVDVQRKKPIKAMTLRPVVTEEMIRMAPLQWYVDLMMAGLRLNNAPVAYLKKIASIEIGSALSYPLGAFDKAILKYPGTVKKFLSLAVQLINELNNGGEFTLAAGRHPLNGRIMNVVKEAVGFGFETSVALKRGLQNHQDLLVDNPDLILSKKYRIRSKGYVVTSIVYGDAEKWVTGGIHQIQSLNLPADNIWRLIIPVDKKPEFRDDFQYQSFLLNGRLHQGLLSLQILDAEIHLYGIKINKQDYVIVDALSQLSLKRFQEISHSVLLVFAILKGNYYSGDGYFIAYKNIEMRKPLGMAYFEMSSSVRTLPGIFTTNAFTGIEKRKYRKNNKGMIPRKLIKNIQKGMSRFSREQYAALCTLMLTKEKILRAIIQIVHNQHATLEIKIPVLYVALETITAAYVDGGNKDLKPIEDDSLNDKLVVELKKTVDDFTLTHNFTDEQLKRLQPLINKLFTLNAPPNADKLSKIFPLLGYEPTKEDKAVIKERNSFLHGSSLKLKLTDHDYGFKKLYDHSLRLYFLLIVLLLKKVGFSGKILNYNKLHEHITEIYRDEDVFATI